jgi:hypothetical protein
VIGREGNPIDPSRWIVVTGPTAPKQTHPAHPQRARARLDRRDDRIEQVLERTRQRARSAGQASPVPVRKTLAIGGDADILDLAVPLAD